MANLNYARSNMSLKAFTPVLLEWINITTMYAKGNPDDSSWSYNERATLSTFAGAAWRKGWFALEEFGTDKHTHSRDADTGAKLKSYGRCDLYLDNGSKSYVVEAKQAWQPIGPQVRTVDREVRRKCQAAFKDAGQIPRVEADRRLALTFVAPSFPSRLLDRLCMQGGTPEQHATDVIEKWLNSIRVMKSIDAMAWCFPAVTRCLTNESGTRIFPGIVALIRERKKAARVGRG